MNFSIKRSLLINLILSIVLISCISAAGNYYLNLRDVESHLDAILVDYALAVHSTMHQAFHKQDLKKLQGFIDNQMAKQIQAQLSPAKLRQVYHGQIKLQIVDSNNCLLIASYNSPKTVMNLQNEIGFKNFQLNHSSWRVFTWFDPKRNIKIIVGAMFDLRDRLVWNVVLNYLLISLSILPATALFMWFIVDLGFKSVKRIVREISKRDPTHLASMSFDQMPEEIKPFVNAINELLERIEAGLEREQRFAGDAAHELKTPLAVLKTQAQVAVNASNANEREIALSHLLSGVDRCTHIIQQLLILSRLTPGENYLLEKITKVDLPKLAADVVAQLIPTALEKEIEVALEQTHPHILLQAYPTMMGILIRNLVDNAIRYTPAHGQVTIKIENSPQAVILSVADTGPGIPEELRARVFERFFRILGTQASGSGLGLAIVQQIAQLHKAVVKLEAPAQGRGLIVKIFFPTHIH